MSSRVYIYILAVSEYTHPRMAEIAVFGTIVLPKWPFLGTTPGCVQQGIYTVGVYPSMTKATIFGTRVSQNAPSWAWYGQNNHVWHLGTSRAHGSCADKYNSSAPATPDGKIGGKKRP